MSLKDSLNSVKNELSSDEKLLEQAFHIEKFYKRHKIKILSFVVFVILLVLAYSINNYIENKKLINANEAFLILEKDPNNKKALEELKSNNPKLYNLFIYSLAVDKENPKLLENLKVNNEILKDIISYHKAVLNNKITNSKYYENLVLVERAYLAIKKGQKDKAKTLLIQVDNNSPLKGIAKLLEHYIIK